MNRTPTTVVVVAASGFEPKSARSSLGESIPASGVPAHGKQDGFVMIAVILMIGLLSAYLIANSVGWTNAEISNERQLRTLDALKQAKAALIAYAASEQWQLYRCSSSPCRFQPGALPCPDKDDDGDSEGICANAATRIGRLPWKTLGAEELRDASGEHLWYALSASFRKVAGTTIVNSDTPGQLTVTGATPANGVAAIVFAPGPVLAGQNRDPANAVAHNDPASYLEGFSAAYDTFTTSVLPSGTFNDRLLVVTQADLMAVVEPVVAARIQRDVKPYLDNYRAVWGRYPFAAPFSNPVTSDYKGAAGRHSGWLPLTADSSFVTWQTPSSTTVSHGRSGSVSSYSCTASGASLIDCTVAYSGQPTLRFDLRALGAGMAFVRAHVIGDLTVTDLSSGLSLAPAPTLSGTYALLADGTGTVSLRLDMPPAAAASVRIQIPPPPLQPPASAWDNTMMTLATPYSAAGAGWFISNQWHRSVFYAVAPALAPGGSGDCTSHPPCITVNNLGAPNDNKQAILVLAGRYLKGDSRPPSPAIGDFLENANLTALTTTSYVYEHRSGVPTSINDRVAVVSP